MENDRSMKSVENTDVCWVCVLQSEGGAYDIRLTNDPSALEESRSWQIIYRRQFSDTLVAAGYRIVLSNISRKSLERVVKLETPTWNT